MDPRPASEVSADVGPDGARVTITFRGPDVGWQQSLSPDEAVQLAERLLRAVQAIEREVA